MGCLCSCCNSVWSQFKQQRLPAWQPLLSPGYISIVLLIVAVIVTPLAAMITLANLNAKDFTFRYDQINRCTSANNQGAFTYTGNGAELSRGCITSVAFELTESLQAPVYLYYGLTNFYQNHRRFTNSKSDAQLAGGPMPSKDNVAVSPMGVPGMINNMRDTPITLDDRPMRYRDMLYNPAGLIPWAMFNDTFALYLKPARLQDAAKLVCNGTAFSFLTNEPLPDAGPNNCHKKGIAWTSDVKYMYKPALLDFPYIWSADRRLYGAPIVSSDDDFYDEGWYAGELGHRIPVTTDEDLMVWARSASLPSFRKLYRIIDVNLEPGNYVMEIEEHYDVSSFGGEKSFTLSTLSWIGGRNVFLATMYWVVGGVSFVSALALLVLRHFFGDRAQMAVGLLVAGS